MEPFRRLARRYVRADPRKADAGVAAAFIAFWILEASIIDPEGGSRPLSMVLGTLTLLAFAWRRRDPLLAAVWFGVGSAVQSFTDSFWFGPHSNTSFIAAIFLAYSTGRWSERRVWPTFLVLLALLAIGSGFSTSFEGPADYLWLVILFTPPVLAGRAIRSRVLLRRELRDKAERLEADREREAEAAVADERSRIATELQTVVANSVSAIVVQAEAVPLLLADGDDVRAKEAFEVIEETGRDALTEMRRLLGVLRHDGDRPELAPLPGLGRLDALIAETREQGMKIDLTVIGERSDLAPGVDLTAYRALQAALASATAAGAARATTIVNYGGRELEIEVRDDRSADGHGDGGDPVGDLRERFSLYSGFVRARDEDDGEHVFEARLPLTAAARAEVGS